MNKEDNTEYTGNNRHLIRRRDNPMLENLVHDMEYTFADEYYSDLKNDYYESLKEELKSDEE